MNKYILFFFLVVINLPGLTAQSAKQAFLDSLVSELPVQKSDTAKIILLVKISWQFVDPDRVKALQYANAAIELADKTGWEKGIALSKQMLGRINWKIGEFSKALQYHNEAIAIWQALGDSNNIALVTLMIGQDYADGGNYPEALHYLNDAVTMFEKLNKKIEVGSLQMIISWVYQNMGMTAEDVHHQYAALKIFEEIGDKDGLAVCYSNLASSLVQEEKFDEAIQTYSESEKMMETVRDWVNMAYTGNELGTTYARIGKDSLALLQF